MAKYTCEIKGWEVGEKKIEEKNDFQRQII